MGRSPCCEKTHTNKGAWTREEDQRLIDYIRRHGEGSWRSLPKSAGLLRCGKSCRLRWINYLRPDLKRGNFTEEEDELVIKLHSLLGNKWSLIAARLPGRTDNEIKNYWNTHIKRKLISRGIDPQTHRPITGFKTAPLSQPTQNGAVETSLEIPKCIAGMKTEPSSEFYEEANYATSGTTTDEDLTQNNFAKFPKLEDEGEGELNLELRLGFGPSRLGVESASVLGFGSAESRPSPVKNVSSTKGVCLCCNLRFRPNEPCRNCQISNGFLRF